MCETAIVNSSPNMVAIYPTPKLPCVIKLGNLTLHKNVSRYS